MTIFFAIFADTFDCLNCGHSHSKRIKNPNSKSLLILLSSAGRAKSLQAPTIVGGNHRSTHKFAASHGSARRRETRQHRSRPLAIAGCVTAHAPQLVTLIFLILEPTANADVENPRLLPLQRLRRLMAYDLFEVAILQKMSGTVAFGTLHCNTLIVRRL